MQHHKSKITLRMKSTALLILMSAILFLFYWARRPPVKRNVPVQQSVLVSPASVVISSGTIGEGGSLSHSMSQAGVNALVTSQVERALKPLFNPHSSKPTDHFLIERSTSGQSHRIAILAHSVRIFTIDRRATGDFTASSSENRSAGIAGRRQRANSNHALGCHESAECFPGDDLSF